MRDIVQLRDEFLEALSAYRRRLRVTSFAAAVIAGAAAGALVATVDSIYGADSQRIGSAAAAFAIVTLAVAGLAWRRLTSARVTAAVESRSAVFDNLLVTAEEEAARSSERRLHPVIAAELFDETIARIRQHPPAAIVPLVGPLVIALAALVAAVVLVARLPQTLPADAANDAGRTTAAGLTPGDLRVTVTPPAYIPRTPTVSVNPASVSVIEGGRVRLEMPRTAATPVLVTETPAAGAFRIDGDLFACEFVATTSQALVVRQGELASGGTERLVHLAVVPDARPIVTIRTPGKDLMFSEPKGQVSVEIEARDDIALESLKLRYTKMSGSGEGFTFKEGDLPIRVDHTSADAWTGRGTVSIADLALADGDTLVYHATAQDRKPGAEPSVSESFLIEIGRAAGIASTGFALPEDRERQALSQQMLIVKTERLHAQRQAVAGPAFDEQAKLLAMEQRMVRAEFVFMTGGEVEDEEAEAASSNELAEGRLENQGHAELLAAIREMSRAEARLNAADTTQALVFERNALRALQRAFDRRRYLLRTTPERARIDLQQRLRGDLVAARSSAEDAAAPAQNPLSHRVRVAMAALSGAEASSASAASLGARILDVDPASEPLRRAALQLSASRSNEERAAALDSARSALLGVLKASLASAAEMRISGDPLQGRVADELAKPQK